MLSATQYPKLPMPDDKVEFLANIHPKLGDLYSQSRTDQHVIAQAMLLRLYATGAALINEGTAYRQHQSANIKSQEEWVLKNRPFALERNSQTLLALYHKIPTYIEDTRGRQGKLINPFHLFFLAKVALDHMEAQEIYKLLQRMGVEASCLTTGTSVTLPNGSRVLSDNATSHILYMYIVDNLSKFSFIPEEQKRSFGKLHHYEVLARQGNRDKVTEINTLPLADNIPATLSQEIPVQRQQKPAVLPTKSNPPPAASLPFLAKKRRKQDASDRASKRTNNETESKTLGC